MRAEIQRKALRFQEVTAPAYRCASICVVNLVTIEEAKLR